uniref:Uncharacterized protein n=1 Tax=Ciona savignyi TaxID=51511 RepID=H2ZA81_CIOSA
MERYRFYTGLQRYRNGISYSSESLVTTVVVPFELTIIVSWLGVSFLGLCIFKSYCCTASGIATFSSGTVSANLCRLEISFSLRLNFELMNGRKKPMSKRIYHDGWTMTKHLRFFLSRR